MADQRLDSRQISALTPDTTPYPSSRSTVWTGPTPGSSPVTKPTRAGSDPSGRLSTSPTDSSDLSPFHAAPSVDVRHVVNLAQRRRCTHRSASQGPPPRTAHGEDQCPTPWNPSPTGAHRQTIYGPPVSCTNAMCRSAPPRSTTAHRQDGSLVT